MSKPCCSGCASGHSKCLGGRAPAVGVGGVMDDGDPTALLSTIFTLPANAVGFVSIDTVNSFYTKDPVTGSTTMNATGYAVSAAAWFGLWYLFFHRKGH